MFRYLALLIEIAGTLLAVLSPLCLLHWLFTVTKFKVGLGFLGFVPMLISPFMAILKPLPLPVIQYKEMSVDITQGALSILLLFVFLMMVAIGRIFRNVEMKIEVQKTQHSIDSRVKHTLKEKERREEIYRTKYRNLVYLQFPFQEHMEFSKLFASFQQYNATTLQTQSDNVFFQFQDPKEGFAYILEARQALLDAYSKLRPMDPQPPMRAVLMAVKEADDLSVGLAIIEHVINVAGKNDIVFTDDYLKTLRSVKGENDFDFYSIGEYFFPGAIGEQEVYKLVGVKGS